MEKWERRNAGAKVNTVSQKRRDLKRKSRHFYSFTFLPSSFTHSFTVVSHAKKTDNVIEFKEASLQRFPRKQRFPRMSALKISNEFEFESLLINCLCIASSGVKIISGFLHSRKHWVLVLEASLLLEPVGAGAGSCACSGVDEEVLVV